MILAHLTYPKALIFRGTCRKYRDWWTEGQLHSAMLNLELNQEGTHVGQGQYLESLMYVHEHRYPSNLLQHSLGTCSESFGHAHYNILRPGMIFLSNHNLNFKFWIPCETCKKYKIHPFIMNKWGDGKIHPPGPRTICRSCWDVSGQESTATLQEKRVEFTRTYGEWLKLIWIFENAGLRDLAFAKSD